AAGRPPALVDLPPLPCCVILLLTGPHCRTVTFLFITHAASVRSRSWWLVYCDGNHHKCNTSEILHCWYLCKHNGNYKSRGCRQDSKILGKGGNLTGKIIS